MKRITNLASIPCPIHPGYSIAPGISEIVDDKVAAKPRLRAWARAGEILIEDVELSPLPVLSVDLEALPDAPIEEPEAPPRRRKRS